ncbi:MAG: hypothetical protein ACYTGH_04300 [Planctomycetota bacterium]
MEILPIDMVTFIENARNRAQEGRTGYLKEAAAMREAMTIEHFDDDEPLVNILSVRDQMLAHGEEHGLDCIALQDFTSLVDAMGCYCYHANSLVGDTLPVSCESDIHGAISNVMLHRAAYGATPVYLADITVRHPEDDNGILLWHGGAPLSMLKEGETARLGKHWILPSPLAGMPHYEMKGGKITTTRFDGDRGTYQLAVGEGDSMEGPKTLNSYVWMKVDDWPRWERKLMEGPFIHHAAMAYGHYGEALLEACKFVDGLEPVRLNA